MSMTSKSKTLSAMIPSIIKQGWKRYANTCWDLKTGTNKDRTNL